MKTVFGHLKFEFNINFFLLLPFSNQLLYVVMCWIHFFSELPRVTKEKYEQNFWFNFAFNLAIDLTLWLCLVNL